MRPSAFAVSTLALAVLAFGCGDAAQTPAAPSAPTTTATPSGAAGGGGTGTLTLRITDSPFSEARAVLVTFNEVSVHRSGAGWETMAFAGGAGQRTCDLKKLQGPADLLGVGTLPSGHYTQIRLHIVSASIHFDNASAGGPCATSIAAPTGLSAPVEIPSGEVKLNRQFTIPAGGATLILLDLDGDRSIHQTGGSNGNNNGNNGNGRGNSGGGTTTTAGRYIMNPVISVVSVS